jgi:hypothetical protein
VLLLQPVCVLPDVVTTRYLIALLNVLEREQFVVAVAHVTHAKVNAGAVRSRTYHQSLHRLWHPDLLHVRHRCLSRLTVATTIVVAMVLFITLIVGSGHRFVSSSIIIMILHHHIIIPIAITNISSMGIIIFYLVEIFRHPVLATVFILGLSREVVGYLSSEAYTGHSFEDDRICYVVSNPHDSSVEAGLYPINLLAVP